MIIKQFIEGPIENNMYLLVDEKSKQAVLIDATAMTDEIADTVKNLGAEVKYILLTHGHFDHIMGLNDLKEALKAEAVINKNDLELSGKINDFTRMFNQPEAVPPTYEKFVDDGDIIQVGDMKIKVITTPGHTEGGVCYLVDENLFSGDTLFRDSVGRTDLVGGSFKKLSDSIKNKLFKLDDNIKVHPGHGPITTIGYEKTHNEIILYN